MNTLLKKRKKQKGFTLIELMVTIAIVGILAAIAVPAYQYYITKARFSELIVAGSEFKPLVSECLATGKCDKAISAIAGTNKEIDVNTGAVGKIKFHHDSTAKNKGGEQIGHEQLSILISPLNSKGIKSADKIVMVAKLAEHNVKWKIYACSQEAANYIGGNYDPDVTHGQCG